MAFLLKYVQSQSFTLAGAGATIGDTTLLLTSFQTIDGVDLTMTDFGSIGYATIEPNNGTSEEQISFTGITQNVNGTATLTGVKTVLFTTPYTQTSGLAKAHAGGVKFVISNTSAFYQEIINYIDGIAIAGSPDMTTTTKGIGEEATAAEINAGTQTGGTSAELVVNPKYLKDSIYYTQLPSADQKAALAGSNGTPSVSNKYVTETGLAASQVPIVRTYLNAGSPHTWTKPAGLKYVIVEVQAGGGGSVGCDNDATESAGAGGGAGGYSRKLIPVASLGATETVTVGAGGTAGASGGTPTAGGTGGTSSFGSHLSATGGSGSSGTGGVSGGVGSNGDINIKGGGSGSAAIDSATNISIGGTGGSSFFGAGGKAGAGVATGDTGGDYGGGAGGFATDTGTQNPNGGAGGPGIVIVTEYYI